MTTLLVKLKLISRLLGASLISLVENFEIFENLGRNDPIFGFFVDEENIIR